MQLHFYTECTYLINKFYKLVKRYIDSKVDSWKFDKSQLDAFLSHLYEQKEAVKLVFSESADIIRPCLYITFLAAVSFYISSWVESSWLYFGSSPLYYIPGLEKYMNLWDSVYFKDHSFISKLCGMINWMILDIIAQADMTCWMIFFETCDLYFKVSSLCSKLYHNILLQLTTLDFSIKNPALVFSIKLVASMSLLILMSGGTPSYSYDYLTKLGWNKQLSITLVYTILVVTGLYLY